MMCNGDLLDQLHKECEGHPRIDIHTGGQYHPRAVPASQKKDDFFNQIKVIEIKPNDDHKNLEALASVWMFLSQNKATRKSLMINLGGGMVTDLGGFAASTFKRGMDYVNVPTTLLGLSMRLWEARRASTSTDLKTRLASSTAQKCAD